MLQHKRVLGFHQQRISLAFSAGDKLFIKNVYLHFNILCWGHSSQCSWGHKWHPTQIHSKKKINTTSLLFYNFLGFSFFRMQCENYNAVSCFKYHEKRIMHIKCLKRKNVYY